MDRIKFASIWLGGCAGCHMSFLDLDEFLIELAGLVDVVYSPVVDPKEYPANVDVCLIEGSACNDARLDALAIPHIEVLAPLAMRHDELLARHVVLIAIDHRP